MDRIETKIIVAIWDIKVEKEKWYSFKYSLTVNGKTTVGEEDGSYSGQSAATFKKVLEKGWAVSLVLQNNF